MRTKIKILLLLVMAALSLNANAQDHDWFIRAGVSTNYYWGEDDCIANFGQRMSPSVNVTLGKWFNPYWGVQVGGNLGKLRGCSYGESPYSTDETIDTNCYKEKWNFFTVQPELVYNVSNGMCGFNEHRVWNVLAHIGPSIARSWANGESQMAVNATAGLTSTWRLCRNVQVWADGRFTIFNKKFDKVTYRDDLDCMGTVTAGISVNF